jgi:hypothetical protein
MRARLARMQAGPVGVDVRRIASGQLHSDNGFLNVLRGNRASRHFSLYVSR